MRSVRLQCCAPHAFMGEQLPTPSHSNMHMRDRAAVLSQAYLICSVKSV